MSAIYECECDSFEMYEEQDSFEMAEAVPGPGVPSGGLTGQVLKKRSDEDFDTEWADESGGGGGTSDYTQLSNKPQINGNTLAGNKTGTDLGLVNAVTGKQLSTEDYTTADKNKLSGIEAQANKTVIDNTLTNAGQAADAKAVGDEISQLESDVEGLQGDLAGLDAGDVAYDNSLTYAAGTVGEELGEQRNTLNHKADVIYDTANGDIASFPDGADGLPVKDLTVGIEPVQDLHGYDYPWIVGQGKNLADPSKFTNRTVSANGGFVSNPARVLTGLIPVTSGTVYTVSCESGKIYLGCRFYDRNLKPLGSNITTAPFNAPDDAAYVCVIFKRSDNANFLPSELTQAQVEAASSPTSYEAYSNICPISGWSGCNVGRNGKNLLNPLMDIGSGYFIDANGIIVSNSYMQYTADYIRVKPNTEYCISGDIFGDKTNAYNSVAFYTFSKVFITMFFPSAQGIPAHFVTPSDCSYIRFNFTAAGDITQIQVEEGSQPTAFESYSGTTIPITFPSSAGTVYGGTLDVTSGVLTVDRASLDMGTASWELTSGYFRLYKSNIVPSPAVTGELMCSCYRNRTDDTSDGIYQTGGQIRVVDSNYSSAEDFKAAVSGQTIVYTIATPQTYQLTPTEVIETLLGQNNIWADCGPSTVEYPADTKLYIDKKLAALVAALS